MRIPSPAKLRFQQASDECASRVLAYALRHTDPDSAQDVVADVFLVAWRGVGSMTCPRSRSRGC
ncbi:MAG: hypothetical protein H0X18_13160 [Geodermatophilaceae bacterium]|nr:hypothetical protein [Geodermatophilaceae bacterium]